MIEIMNFDVNKSEHKLWENDENSTIIRYFPAKEKKSDAAIVVFAGGGYTHRALHEGDGYAELFSEIGIDSFVVDYRVAPEHFPTQLLDARRGVRFVRYYSEKYGIDKEKIAVIGSSAGGHLAALVSTYRGEIEGEGADEIDNECCIPNAQILCYPVISTVDDTIWHRGSGLNLLGEDNLDFAPNVSPDLIADEKTPQAFIWHTAADNAVNVINSYSYASALRRKNVPVEMHIFPNGPHGLGLAKNNKWVGKCDDKIMSHVCRWADLLEEWLTYIGWLA